MAVALDQNLGSNDANTSTTLVITTSAAAAANTQIVTLWSFWNVNAGAVLTGVNDGSAYTLDKRVTNGNDKFEIWSRYAAAGLAPSSSITATLGTVTGTGGILGGAASFTGVLSSGSVDTTSSATGTGTSWSSGAATNAQADSVYVGGSGNEDPTAGTSSTATNGTEIHDRYRATDGQGIATGYKVVSTIASDSVTGNWSNANSTVNTGGLVIYKAAAAAGGVTRTFNPIPFMPGNL
jgi:hypothetical protein